MKKWIISCAAPVYLGFSLGMFADCILTTWQFYAIIVPVIILHEIERKFS
jgi:hypothetical protein